MQKGKTLNFFGTSFQVKLKYKETASYSALVDFN